jgi:hypothetical protein
VVLPPNIYYLPTASAIAIIILLNAIARNQPCDEQADGMNFSVNGLSSSVICGCVLVSSALKHHEPKVEFKAK